MKDLALNLPGNYTIPSPPGLRQEFNSLGGLLSQLFVVVIYIAGFLLIFWFAWGVFHYLFAGGDKNGLAAARKRMTWAVVGFLIIMISFAVSQYVSTIFPQNPVTPRFLTVPTSP